jgi:hypothetical protein
MKQWHGIQWGWFFNTHLLTMFFQLTHPWTVQDTQRWVPEQNNGRRRELGTFPNSQHFKDKGVLELRNGIKMKSQAIVQDEVNLHNQKKRVVSASWMEVVRQT